MKLYYFVPALNFKTGESVFKKPPFWYRCVGENPTAYGYDYYLFPFSLIVRLLRRLYATKSQ